MSHLLYILLFLYIFIKDKALADNILNNNPKIQIKLGGEIDAQLAVNNAYDSYSHNVLPNNTINNGADPVFGRLKAMANLEVSIKTKKNRYGAFVGFQSGKNEDDFGSYARETFIFMEHTYGKIELGSVYSSASRMRIDASQLARATGGIQGDWFRYIALPVYSLSSANLDPSLTLGYNPVFILQPMLPNEAGFTTGAFNGNYVYSNAPYAPVGSPAGVLYQNTVQPRLGWGSISNKISYYTKRIAGLQLGLSYSPNTGLTGFWDRKSDYATDYLGQYYNLNLAGTTGNVNNLVTIGLNYIKQFGDFGIATSFTYESGTYQGNAFLTGGTSYNNFPSRNNLNALAIGIKGIYGPISIAYSYGNWMQSLFSANIAYYNSDGTGALNEAFYHTGGTAVSFGPFNISATYMYSNYRGNQVNLISVGSDIKLRGVYKRLVPYVELTYYNLSPAYGKTSAGNLIQANALQGFIFLTGIKFIF